MTIYTQDSTKSSPFGIGYDQQMVDISKRMVAESEALQVQLDEQLNTGRFSFSNYRAERTKLNELKTNPNADPAAVAAAQAQFDDLAAERDQLQKQQNQNLVLLTARKDGLASNETRLATAEAKAAAQPPGTALATAGADPAAQSVPAVAPPLPPDQLTPAVFGTPNAVTGEEDPYETARLAAEAQADIPANEIVLTPAEQAAADDPFEQRRLELEQEANRQELAREENLNVSNDDPNAKGIDADAAAALEAQQAANRAQLQAEDAQELAAQKAATLDRARAQNTIATQRSNPNNADWRVKLRLAPGSNYLYNDPAAGAGILAPLKGIGIIFPYTPTISTSYKATYSSYDLTHSNYKGYYYQGSAVEPVTLSCMFTAQSTVEAEYLLAVIHFFKSVTKMFYGQDAERGTPPPLVYLTGLGEYQFNEHACVVQSFTYELPTDVDYIRARSPNVNNSSMLNKRQSNNATGPGTTWGNGILGNVLGGAINRLANAGVPKGAVNMPPAPATFGLKSPTYVPTKMNIAITLLPVQSRKQQSQQFSLKQYANGDLLKGGFW